MAYLIYVTNAAGERQYAESIGKTRVTWTTDRTKARRFARYDTANDKARSISNNLDGRTRNAAPPGFVVNPTPETE